MKLKLLVSLSAMCLAALARGQGFVNLDFESAQVIITTGGLATSNAVPGWSVFKGTNQLSTMGHNSHFTADPLLVGSNANVIAGNFSVEMTPGYFISQTGLVPTNAESLLFDANLPSPSVSLDGVNLSYTAISTATNASGHGYYIYGADVSGFAGQVETLTFSGSDLLDDIQFSPEAVPEPSAISFLFLGNGVLLFVRRKYCR